MNPAHTVIHMNPLLGNPGSSPGGTRKTLDPLLSSGSTREMSGHN